MTVKIDQLVKFIRFLCIPMVLLLILSINGCAASRVCPIKLEAKENSLIFVYVNGVEVYKEGVTEGQDAQGTLSIPGLK